MPKRRLGPPLQTCRGRRCIAPLRGVDMRRLRARETFPFPRSMEATPCAMRAAPGGCGGGREPRARQGRFFDFAAPCSR